VELYTQSGLLERGWTKKLIADFAPEPDAVKTNPIFKKAAPMKLYAEDRIRQIEQSDEFINAFQKAKGRKRAARKAVQTKKLVLLNLIDQIEIVIMYDPDIQNNAIASYNNFHDEMGHYDYEPAQRTSDPSFLERITVNYARHNLTRYDTLIDRLYRKVGKQEAYRLLKRRTLEGIAIRYPSLAEECRRQMNPREDPWG
jgi:hypothetical protein